MATSTSAGKYSAPALDKGLDILEHLSKVGTSLSQAEIAEGIDRTPSEIYRMLVRLEERGYLIRAANSGNYRLSLKMYSLSHRHTPFDELKRVSQFPIRKLAESIRQSCHLSVLYNGQLLVISQIRSPEPVSLSIEEGTLFPVSMTTSGKVLLSLLTHEERGEILMRDKFYKGWSKEKKKEFNAAVDRVKKEGHCHSKSKLTNGVTDMAVPIGSSDSELKSVLAVSTLTSVLEDEIDMAEILRAIKETQSKINFLLGL